MSIPSGGILRLKSQKGKELKSEKLIKVHSTIFLTMEQIETLKKTLSERYNGELRARKFFDNLRSHFMHSSENNSPGQAILDSSEGMQIHKKENQLSVVDKLLQHQMNMGSNDD